MTVPPPIPPLDGEGRRAAAGRGAAAPIVERARALRKALTPQEVKVWLALREMKPLGFRFRRQVPLNVFVVDFACFASKLIVEIDGMQHGFDANLARDARRDHELVQGGFVVLRFTNGEVHDNLKGIVETIYRTGFERITPSRASAPLGPPSPRGGGMKGNRP